MTFDLELAQQQTKKGVHTFWLRTIKARLKASDDPVKKDIGNRIAVTSGKNLDGMVDAFSAVIEAAQVDGLKVGKTHAHVTLPGYLRASKMWDLVLTLNGELIAAIEFKSHIGPSFGNNYNNRCEEAIGSAYDFELAYQNGLFATPKRKPFLGWCILVEKCDKSEKKKVGIKTPHFAADSEFKGMTYMERYVKTCRRLEKEKLYSAAAVIATPEDMGFEMGSYCGVTADTTVERLMMELWKHLKSLSDEEYDPADYGMLV